MTFLKKLNAMDFFFSYYTKKKKTMSLTIKEKNMLKIYIYIIKNIFDLLIPACVDILKVGALLRHLHLTNTTLNKHWSFEKCIKHIKKKQNVSKKALFFLTLFPDSLNVTS